MPDPIAFTLNGKPAGFHGDGERKLLWVLRGELGLTGTKCGCAEGLCGACTVVVDKEAVRSCQLKVADVRGREVVTIEGLHDGVKLHPLPRPKVKSVPFFDVILPLLAVFIFSISHKVFLRIEPTCPGVIFHSSIPLG